MLAGGGDDDGPVCRYVAYFLWHFMCSFLLDSFLSKIPNQTIKVLDLRCIPELFQQIRPEDFCNL